MRKSLSRFVGFSGFGVAYIGVLLGSVIYGLLGVWGLGIGLIRRLV